MTTDSLPEPGKLVSVTAEHVPLLATRRLSIAFPGVGGTVFAANQVNLMVGESRALGLVGESGSGKSVTLRAFMGMVPWPGDVVEGEILWRGSDLRALPLRALRELRGREISMVLQDPSSSLTPVYSVGNQLSDVFRRRLGLSRRDARDRAIELLGRVGIPSPAARARAYPHQLSGGMRQRVMIAMAVACKPLLLLADEPTTGLDVTIQDQILSLLVELQAETGMSIVIVSHDLGVIAETADDIAVMYAGYLLEYGPRDRVLNTPRHPYTQALLAAAPTIDPHKTGPPLAPIGGQTPDLRELPLGCPFQPRCPYARPECTEVSMALDAPAPNHGTACPFVEPA